MSDHGLSHDTVQNDHEEPEDSALRVKLGVRPTWYYAEHNHPETRPCPSWCDSADESWSHEIDADHPTIPEHSLGVPVETVASLYLGERDQFPDGWVTRTASLRSTLTQLGVADPVIRVQLDKRENPRNPLDREVLRLSLDDARDLVKALNYLIELTETGN